MASSLSPRYDLHFCVVEGALEHNDGCQSSASVFVWIPHPYVEICPDMAISVAKDRQLVAVLYGAVFPLGVLLEIYYTRAGVCFSN